MAAEISAQLVRELRERTGAGMMDCKRALQDTNGDMEAAVVLLREKGMANAEKRAELSGKLGENIAIAGAARFEAVNGGQLAAYVHPPANKLGVLLHLRGGDDELARNLAMHISWSDPRWIGREDVPEELITAEREIYLNSDEVQSK